MLLAMTGHASAPRNDHDGKSAWHTTCERRRLMQSVVLLHEAPHSTELGAALNEIGYRVVGEVTAAQFLESEVERSKPDVIVVATDSPPDETLKVLGSLAASHPRPVIMFARDRNREVIRRAVECGVAAYVVDGWAAQRLTPIIDAASARFEAYDAVRKELATTRTKLEERKIIEKAKGIVMQQRKLSEAHAYSALRKTAMDQNLALAEVARRVVAVAELLR